MNDYAIIDNKGIIYSGNYDEMIGIWDQVNPDSSTYNDKAMNEYFPNGWEGDIMLVEIKGYIH